MSTGAIVKNIFDVKYFVWDNFLSGKEIQAIQCVWPEDDWAGWVRYDPRYESKKASDTTTKLPDELSEMLAKIATASIGSLLDMPEAVADLSLHGGGLHEHPPGGRLGCHLDADHHPRLGLQRAYSAVLYVHDKWNKGDGGEFLLCDSERNIADEIAPLPGRLIAFDCRNTLHGVARCRIRRKSLALFGYLPTTQTKKRPRAQFVPWKGEEHLEELMNAR